MNTQTNWLINGLLAVILVLLCGVYLKSGNAPAYAAGPGWSTDGVMAMSTNNANERLVIIDTTKQNIAVYKTRANQFRLSAARRYKYDIEIEDTAGGRIENVGATYLDTYGLYQKHLNEKPK